MPVWMRMAWQRFTSSVAWSSWAVVKWGFSKWGPRTTSIRIFWFDCSMQTPGPWVRWLDQSLLGWDLAICTLQWFLYQSTKLLVFCFIFACMGNKEKTSVKLLSNICNMPMKRGAGVGKYGTDTGDADPVEDNSRALNKVSQVISRRTMKAHQNTHTQNIQKNPPQNQNNHPKQRNKNMKNEHFPSEMLHSYICQIVVFFLLE